MSLVIGTREHTYDCRHWRAGILVRYTTENTCISHCWGNTHEIQARADHQNSIHPINRLVPAVDPLGRLGCRLRGLSLRGLDDAASHPAQLASAHGDVCCLARDLSYRTTATYRYVHVPGGCWPCSAWPAPPNLSPCRARTSIGSRSWRSSQLA